MPVYFIWLEYLSWLKYGQEVLVINQWQDIKNISKCVTPYLPLIIIIIIIVYDDVSGSASRKMDLASSE